MDPTALASIVVGLVAAVALALTDPKKWPAHWRLLLWALIVWGAVYVLSVFVFQGVGVMRILLWSAIVAGCLLGGLFVGVAWRHVYSRARVGRIRIQWWSAIVVGSLLGGGFVGVAWRHVTQPPKGDSIPPGTTINAPGGIVGGTINNPTINNYGMQSGEIADELLRLRRIIGSRIAQDELRSKYPVGYTIFKIRGEREHQEYETQLMDQYKFDWNVAAVTLNTPERIELRLPDILRKDGKRGFTNITTGGPRRLGNLGGVSVGGLLMIPEILEIRDDGVVFLVGFLRKPQLPGKR